MGKEDWKTCWARKKGIRQTSWVMGKGDWKTCRARKKGVRQISLTREKGGWQEIRANGVQKIQLVKITRLVKQRFDFSSDST